MRIIQVCTSRDQLRRGAEQFCLTLSTSLTQSNNVVTLVTGNRGAPILDDLPFSYATISEVKNPILRKIGLDYFNPVAVRSFKAIVDNFKPDIIHFHSFYGLSSSLAQVMSATCPVIVTLHDSWLAYIDGGILSPHFGLANSYLKVPQGYIHRLINISLMKNAILVSPSIWMKRFFEQSGFQSPLHIPNGARAIESPTAYRDTILWIGALTTFKGLPSVIHILSEISTIFGWRLVVVGDGPHRRTLKLQYPNIDFVGYQDPAPYLKDASILIVSSVGYENFPTVILEGMQHGLCIVGHDLGGIAEMIQNNVTGILYQSAESLKTTLTKLINEPERIRQLGISAKSIFEKKYQWDTCFKRYLNLYRQAIANSLMDPNLC